MLRARSWMSRGLCTSMAASALIATWWPQPGDSSIRRLFRGQSADSHAAFFARGTPGCTLAPALKAKSSVQGGTVMRRVWWIGFALLLIGPLLFAAPAPAQADLTGVIDIHAHSDPDSMPRSIDAINLAKLAKQRGMRGLVLKNHYESTAALAYIVRKEVPGIEIFGGIDLNRSVGGINPAAIERMVLMAGGFGKVVWMPTFDSENQVKFSKENRPFVSVTKNGKLLPEVLDVIALVAKNQLTLETGHSSAVEGLMIVKEAKRQGVQHIVVTHAMSPPVQMSIAQ